MTLEVIDIEVYTYLKKVLKAWVVKHGNTQEVTGGFECLGLPNLTWDIDGTYAAIVCSPERASEFRK